MTTLTKKIVAHGAFGPGQGESSYEYLRRDEDYRALQAACKGLAAQVEALTKARDGLAPPEIKALQAEGKGPAPCARFCEAKAFEIEIRNLDHERDEYQQAADTHAMQYKVVRDTLTARLNVLEAAGKMALDLCVKLSHSPMTQVKYLSLLRVTTALKQAGVS